MMDFVNDFCYRSDQWVIDEHFELDDERFNALRPLRNCA